MRSLAPLAAAMALIAGCGGGGGDAGGGMPAPGAPTATLTAPPAFADNLGGAIDLAATAGGGGVAVEFEVDGVMVGGEDTSAPFGASVDTAAYASGQHVIRARSRDASGNRSAWSSITVRFGGGRTAPAGFTRNEAYVTGLADATAFVQTPDGRFLVAQQGGQVRVVKNGALLPTPFHQLANVSSVGERGVIGITVHPGFAANGWVYVHYTTTVGGVHNRVARLMAGGDVSGGSEFALGWPIELPGLSSATNHNGGAIHFGTDGKLYVGVGDNANSAHSQDLTRVLGKILRFNDDGSIPGDNPFCATAGVPECAVWARGLRNPFTFAVQPGTGRLHINDVGEGTWEEISLGTAGANHGWPGSEGPDNVGAGVTGPLFAYRQTATSPPGTGPGGFLTGQAIAGGTFYPSTGNFPAPYHGSYFFADHVSRFVARLDLANDNVAYTFGHLSDAPVDMLVGLDGALYVLTRSGITRFSAP